MNDSRVFVHESVYIDEPYDIGDETKVWHPSSGSLPNVRSAISLWGRWTGKRICYCGSLADFRSTGKLSKSVVVIDQTEESSYWQRHAPAARAILLLFGLFFVARLSGAEVDRHPLSSDRSAAKNANAVTNGSTQLLILVNVDTLRADRLGAYGNSRGLAPAMDALASDGVLFENAYAASNHTRPSVASLFTGVYPSSHRFWFEDSEVVSKPNIATVFRRAGWTTLWFNANPNTSVFRESFHQGWGEWKNRDQYYFPASEVVPIVEEGIERADKTSPLFVYLQLTDPHGPYTPAIYPPDLFAGDSIRDKYHFADLRFDRKETPTAADVENAINRYDAEIREMDSALGALLARLAIRFDLSVILTADHGESFGEYGTQGHGSSVQEEQIRVPLIFWSEGKCFRRGVRVASVVSQVDVLPTLREILDVPPLSREHGQSLAPLVMNGGVFDVMRATLRLANREVLVETKYSADYILKTFYPELYEGWRGFDLTPLGRAIVWRSLLGEVWKSTSLSHKLAVFRVVPYRMQDADLSRVTIRGEIGERRDDLARVRWAKINRRVPMDRKPVPAPSEDELKKLKALGHVR